MARTGFTYQRLAFKIWRSLAGGLLNFPTRLWKAGGPNVGKVQDMTEGEDGDRLKVSPCNDSDVVGDRELML